jgi:hypothetical protein
MQIRLVWRKCYIVVEINSPFGNRGNSTLLNLTQQQGEVRRRCHHQQHREQNNNIFLLAGETCFACSREENIWTEGE